MIGTIRLPGAGASVPVCQVYVSHGVPGSLVGDEGVDPEET